MSDNNKNMSIGAKLGIASFGLLICVIGVLTYYIIYFNSKKYKKSILGNYTELYQIPETAKRLFDGPEGGPPYIDFINPKNKTDGVILNIENKGTAANLVTWQQSGISESQVENLGKSFSFDNDKINFNGNVTGNVTGDVTGDVNGKTGSFSSSVTSPTFTGNLSGNVNGTTGKFSTNVTAPTFTGNLNGNATTAYGKSESQLNVGSAESTHWLRGPPGSYSNVGCQVFRQPDNNPILTCSNFPRDNCLISGSYFSVIGNSVSSQQPPGQKSNC